MAQSSTIQNPAVRQAILSHLDDPLSPNTKSYNTIKEFVAYPLEKPLQPGGLTPLGIELAKKFQMQDLITASRKHKELTRIHITAVLKSCQLYSQLHNPKTPRLDAATQLMRGLEITLPTGKVESVLLVVRRGELLSKPLQKMMTKLYRALSLQNSEFTQVLYSAANLHKTKKLHTVAPDPSIA